MKERNMAVYSFTTSTGQVVAVNSTGGDYGAPPTIQQAPLEFSAPAAPDYLLDSPVQDAYANGDRAGVRVPNPAPTGTVTVAACVVWKNPA